MSRKFEGGNIDIGQRRCYGMATVSADGEINLPAKVREIGIDVGDRLIVGATDRGLFPQALMLCPLEARQAALSEYLKQLTLIVPEANETKELNET